MPVGDESIGVVEVRLVCSLFVTFIVILILVWALAS